MKQDLTTQFTGIIASDEWMIEILRTVQKFALNDAWIGAGFVRNKIWDHLHNMKRSPLNDIDIIHFDKNNATKERDLLLESKLRKIHPLLNWSIKNQARMHIRNGHSPYKDCNEAISYWPETATSVAIRLNQKNEIEFIAPHGLEDLFNLLIVPTPGFDLNVYNERIKKKGWEKYWQNLIIKTNLPNS